MHQGEQTPDFARGKSLAGEPREVVSGQVSDHAALVFAERHFARHQLFEVLRVHGGYAPSFLRTPPFSFTDSIRANLSMPFQSLGLDPALARAAAEKGYVAPTAIQ